MRICKKKKKKMKWCWGASWLPGPAFRSAALAAPSVEDLKGAALYSGLKEYLLTEGQLKENGYPFPHPEKPGGAIIFTAEK